MTEAIYRKVQRGKRVHYELIGNSKSYYDSHDVLRPGKFRLEFASMNGLRRYSYPVAADAEQLAAESKAEFKRFSLQDCRPMGVTTKMERGDTDTQDATLHTDGKMIATVYDRRALKRATPAA